MSLRRRREGSGFPLAVVLFVLPVLAGAALLLGWEYLALAVFVGWAIAAGSLLIQVRIADLRQELKERADLEAQKRERRKAVRAYEKRRHRGGSSGASRT